MLLVVGFFPSVVACSSPGPAKPGMLAAVLADSTLGQGRLSRNTVFLFELALTS